MRRQVRDFDQNLGLRPMWTQRDIDAARDAQRALNEREENAISAIQILSHMAIDAVLLIGGLLALGVTVTAAYGLMGIYL